ncbi:dihydrolipoamide acetyltransferase family protein [Hydrogenimonas sp. SS33]|uniref:dihydrolipoamide acetyltransferase family protein n=1 Tax=Hydrogenimonas leucolamina TaxID=2954236 RepID=UPI00336C1ACA
MAYNIVMPQLSDSMTEGKLVSWKVKPGDHVKVGDTIAEVESDKAIMEVQTFHDGVVKELKVKEGESAPVGSVIAVIEEAGSKAEPSDARSAVRSEQTVKSSVANAESGTKREEPKATKVPKTSDQRPTTNEKESSTTKEQQSQTTNDQRQTSKSIVDELFGTETPTAEKTASHYKPSTPHSDEGPASPRARALAARYGLDIEALQKKGELPEPAHADDIERYYRRKYFTPKAWHLLEVYHIPPDLFETGKKHDETEVKAYIESHDIPLPKPLDANRKAVIAAVESAAGKPVYHIYDRIDATLLKEHETHELTVTVWLLKLLAETMMRHEALRTTLVEGGLQVWPQASISLAMANGDALYMPVFKNLEKKSTEEIAADLAAMKEKVRSGRILPEDMRGSTFGLSNLGMTGIERFDAMINKNDSGIAAAGSEIDGKIAVTITFDHRLVNGWQGAEAMQTLKKLAEDPALFKG